MKNYYEILEVSQNASPEVIEKAYKTLVKKYHPDLQPQEEKANSENKIKEINEAYEILSDKLKKEKYDIELNQRKMQEEKAKYSNVQNSNNNNSTSSNNQYNSNNYVVKKRLNHKMIIKAIIYKTSTIKLSTRHITMHTIMHIIKHI